MSHLNEKFYAQLSVIAGKNAEIRELTEKLERTTSNVTDLFSSSSCEVHNEEIKRETFGEYVEKEGARGCLRCLSDKLEAAEELYRTGTIVDRHLRNFVPNQDSSSELGRNLAAFASALEIARKAGLEE